MQSRKTRILITTLGLCLLAAAPGFGSEIATATIASSPSGVNTFHYSLVLNDTGTTNVGTFWFSWVPGQDYMPTTPTNITSPTGWTRTITGGTLNDGFAIRWVAGAGSAITPGGTLSGFGFDSLTTPAEMAGAASFFSHPPVLTSFVYSGAPFSDAGFQFVVTDLGAVAPEPSSVILLGAGLVALSAIRRRKLAR